MNRRSFIYRVLAVIGAGPSLASSPITGLPKYGSRWPFGKREVLQTKLIASGPGWCKYRLVIGSDGPNFFRRRNA